MKTSTERAVRATPPSASQWQVRRWVGLALLPVGIGLAFGGLALPWLHYTCVANCQPGALNGPYVPASNDLFPTCALPFWMLLAAVAVVTAAQERLPTSRRSATPALLLAGLLAGAAAIALLGLLAISPPIPPRRPWNPVVETALGLGGFVSLLGGLLVAVGGWLRYHPRPLDAPRELAEVPTER